MKKDLIIILLLLIPAIAPLFQKGYFSMHDDLQSMRQMELDKCFNDGQIPCRWVTDLGYGYGYPLFNYYPPLPYLIGQPFRWLGLQYIDVVKAVGVLGFGFCAISMYLLGREIWGRSGGLVSSLMYTYAPYHSVDFYVRGAMNEFWAMAFYPAVLWTTYRLIRDGKRWVPWVSLSVAGIMLSHNPMLMIFTPALIMWCLFWLVKFKKSFTVLFTLSIAAFWALGLAAFFTLPVLLEAKYVSLWTLTSGYFNYLAHFLDLRQIFFFINWGYGSSELGPNDSMSFALGYLQWIIPLIVILATPFVKKLRDNRYLILFLAFWILLALFMTHSKSTEIWKIIKPLEFLQFPWRFLTVAVFFSSFLSGAFTLISKKLLLSISLALILILNANYFRPRQWYPDMTDSLKFSGKSWQLLVTSGIFDYLPIYAPLPPADPRGNEVNLIQGTGIYSPIAYKSNYQEYLITITSPSAIAELQTYYFPGWQIQVDGQTVNIDPSRDPLLGRMQVDLTAGTHKIVAKLSNTPIRFVGNTFSLLSWLLILPTLLLSMATYRKNSSSVLE